MFTLVPAVPAASELLVSKRALPCSVNFRFPQEEDAELKITLSE